MSEQGLSPQRRELEDRLHEERVEDGLNLIREGRTVAEATEETVRVTIDRAVTVARPSSLLEVEEEEDVLEMVSAMIIADAAAITAAQAAALAEVSSLRVREAHASILQADQQLENIRAAIRKGKLQGDDADNALRAAVLTATQAHTILADAEKAEKRALSAAIQAEADAKATESQAFTTNNLHEKLHD